MEKDIYQRLLNIFVEYRKQHKEEQERVDKKRLKMLLDEFHLSISDTSTPVIEKELPKIIGYLNREYGFHGYKMSITGTPIYELDNMYYFESFPENEKHEVRKVKFYKETLKPHIQFI